jgi:hypothetical protein
MGRKPSFITSYLAERGYRRCMIDIPSKLDAAFRRKVRREGFASMRDGVECAIANWCASDDEFCARLAALISEQSQIRREARKA